MFLFFLLPSDRSGRPRKTDRRFKVTSACRSKLTLAQRRGGPNGAGGIANSARLYILDHSLLVQIESNSNSNLWSDELFELVRKTISDSLRSLGSLRYFIEINKLHPKPVNFGVIGINGIETNSKTILNHFMAE